MAAVVHYKHEIVKIRKRELTFLEWFEQKHTYKMHKTTNINCWNTAWFFQYIYHSTRQYTKHPRYYIGRSTDVTGISQRKSNLNKYGFNYELLSLLNVKLILSTSILKSFAIYFRNISTKIIITWFFKKLGPSVFKIASTQFLANSANMIT